MALPMSVEKRIRTWKKKTVIKDGHWLFTSPLDKDGHGRTNLFGKQLTISRASAHIFLGLDLNDPKQQANHKRSCPYPNCWNPDCLYVGTQARNIQDSVRLGNHKAWGKS